LLLDFLKNRLKKKAVEGFCLGTPYLRGTLGILRVALSLSCNSCAYGARRGHKPSGPQVFSLIY